MSGAFTSGGAAPRQSATDRDPSSKYRAARTATLRNHIRVIRPQAVHDDCGQGGDSPGQTQNQRVCVKQSVKSFTHLHVHTEYSMLDGAARVDAVVAKAAQDGQPAIGITDHGNMYGVLEFYRAARKAGIKPVIGTEAYLAHEHRSERPPAAAARWTTPAGTPAGGPSSTTT